MTDYLGPLALGTSGTYTLLKWEPSSGNSANIEVIVRATSGDTLAAALEALAAQLYFGNTYVHYWPGVTNPVTFSVIGAGPMKQDDLVSWPVFWQKVAFTLNLAANPAGALTTLYSAQHVDTPASVALSALLGTHPTPLDVTIDDDAGTAMHSVLAALAPTALQDAVAPTVTGASFVATGAHCLVYAANLTWTTMSNGTGADMWGNSSRYTTSASAQTAPLDTSQYPAGKYRLYGRPKQAAGTGYVKDSQNDTWVAVTRTTPHLVVIGDLDLPVSDTAPGVASNLTLSVKSDGTNRFDINAYLVVPLEYGFFSWHHATATTEIVKLGVGPSGIFMDGVQDMTYFAGGILTPRVLAAHVGTLVATASPSGTSWPADWNRTNGTDVTAASSKFHIVCAGATTKTAWYAATNAATPLIVPGAWYELSLTRSVTAWSAGTVQVQIVWQDVDGNTVRTDALSSVAAVDGSPVALTLYAKAPVNAARAQVLFGGISATATMDFYTVVLRRCPLRLIVVAEDAAGALTSYLHPVHLTLKYNARYEVAR